MIRKGLPVGGFSVQHFDHAPQLTEDFVRGKPHAGIRQNTPCSSWVARFHHHMHFDIDLSHHPYAIHGKEARMLFHSQNNTNSIASLLKY
jgi:hypothetical protein